jgi:hypothetical protein
MQEVLMDDGLMIVIGITLISMVSLYGLVSYLKSYGTEPEPISLN